MKSAAGLWIDHRKAIVVEMSDKGENTRQILSNVEKQLGRIDGKHSAVSFESQLVQSDYRQQCGFTKHLDGFYDEVIASIQDAESILLFGPGEAKGELKKRMERNNHGNKVLVMETADKMTDRQISAKVRHYFSKKIVRGK